ncbi:hypothetical protein V7124_19795 [Neobacillus niacini]|uniref:hypothetical protein n=1 Tax=Neobacillus niacini TaxID=86668 RepID=UPI0030003284
MTRITNKNQNPSPLEWERNLYSLAGYLEGDYQEELGSDEPLVSNLSCLDVALDGGFTKGLYMLMATEQSPKFAFITQLAEAFAKQDFGVLFITPKKNLSILPAFVLSRQTLLHDFRNEKPIDELMPVSSDLWNHLSETVKEQTKLLVKNMGVIDSLNITTDFLKGRINALKTTRYEKFMCFVDASHIQPSRLDSFLEDYRQLAEELEMPIIIFTKVPVEEGKDFLRIMDGISHLVDYLLFLNRTTANSDPMSLSKGKENLDWLLYKCHVMPSYSAPEFRKCYLTVYSKFGLFSEA